MPDWPDMLEELLEDDSDRMSAWEIEFVNSLDKQSDNEDWKPSAKQRAVLERIWKKLND